MCLCVRNFKMYNYVQSRNVTVRSIVTKETVYRPCNRYMYLHKFVSCVI